MSTLDYNAELAAAGANVKNRWGAIRFFMRRYPLGTIGAVIMGVFAFAALFAPMITYYDPLSTNAAFSLAKPSAAHWLGCDFMGRDVYSRIVYGARISLAVGIGSTFLGAVFGVALGLGSAILVEASLSFLGLGIPEPHPSWGRMLSESAAEYVRTAPWLVIFPGVAISLVVFGTNLLGDALRDLLDPRLRH